MSVMLSAANCIDWASEMYGISINEFYKIKLKTIPKIAILGLNHHCESIHKISEEEKNMVLEKISEEEKWIEEEHTKDEYEERLNAFNTSISPIMTKLYGNKPGEPNMGVPNDVNMKEEPVNMEPSIDEVD